MSSLNLATTALSAHMAALQVVGNNIANANTEGYSRQSIALRPVEGQQLGTGYYGKGVEVAEVSRSYNAFLTRDANQTKALAASDTARYDQLQQLEQLFPTGDAGLGTQLNGFLNSWSDVAASPADLTARAVVLSRGEEVANRIRQTASQIEEMRTTTQLRINSTIDEQINSRATQLADLNKKIVAMTGTGVSPNDLLDSRDRLLNELNQYVKTTTLNAQDGSVTVFVGGSYPLVMGPTATPLIKPVENATGELQLAFGNQATTLDTELLGGGELQGLLRFYNQDLENAQSKLDQLASTLATAVNAQHVQGVDLAGTGGQDFFLLSADPAVRTSNSISLNTALKPENLAVADPAVTDASGVVSKFNAGNAEKILALRDKSSQTDADGDGIPDDPTFGVDGYSLSDSYIGVFQSVASSLLAAKSAASLSGTVATASEQARANEAGVNLDEEAARLLQYQQGYQAAAKYLQTAQSMFDTLLQTFS